MYRAFFGFREKPFNLTPDPKFLYLNASYREALAALHYGVSDRKGFVSLIGEAGTGKTTLLRRLLAELPRETRSVLVINPAIGFEEMLRFILTDLGRPPAVGATKLEMLEVLNAELLDTLARGGNVVVLIDEAQDLTIPVLEDLRLLSNLETAKEKILQFVLAGQPEFETLLARSEIRQLRQRITVRARLRALARSEVKAYVGARIAAAGGDVRGLFTPGALFLLWRFSGGVPRLVNAACDNALITAYAAGRRTIGRREIGEAVRDLRRQTPRTSRMRLAPLLLAAAVGGGLVLGGTWLLRDQYQAGSAVAPIPPAVPTSDGAPADRSHSLTGELAAVAVDRPADAVPVAIETPEMIATPEVDVSPSAPAGEIPQPAEVAKPDEASNAAKLAEAGGEAMPEAAPAPHGAPPTERSVTEDTAAPSGHSHGQGKAPDIKLRVEIGDTLTDIALRYYGNAGPRVLATIKDANPWLADPDVIWVGKILVLPAPRLKPNESSTDDALIQ